MNKEGAVAGMVGGLLLMIYYILAFKFNAFGETTSKDWWWGISPEGFGTVAMCTNFLISIVISAFTPPPPVHVQHLTESIRYPKGAKAASGHH
jgi:cation/acetate symporter